MLAKYSDRPFFFQSDRVSKREMKVCYVGIRSTITHCPDHASDGASKTQMDTSAAFPQRLVGCVIHSWFPVRLKQIIVH